MKKDNYSILDWDSNFLGFKVAFLSDEMIFNWETVFAEMSTNNIRLVYVFTLTEINEKILHTWNGKLVDRKKTFWKKISNNATFHPKINYYIEGVASDRLLDLAFQSGAYSRFKIDENMPKGTCERLYKIWVQKSVDKSLAKETIVYNDTEIKGFTTVGEKNSMGDIGLVAVAANSRGQGIGKALMNAAENWFFSHGYTEIQVVTQGENIPACRLYESVGFVCNKTEMIYHFWL